MKTKNNYSNMLTFSFTNENGEARTLDLQIKLIFYQINNHLLNYNYFDYLLVLYF